MPTEGVAGWKAPGRGRDWFFCGYVAICLALIGLLSFADWQRRTQVAEYIVANERRVEAEEEARRGQAGKAYGLVSQAIQESIPRIVCLGDEYMAGNQKGSLPARLQRLISQEVFGELGSRINPSIRQMNLTSLKIPVENLGVLNETMDMAVVRFGGGSLYLYEDLVLPAKGDWVPVDFQDASGNRLLVAKQALTHFGLVSLEGVKGYLYSTGDLKDSIHYQTAFRPITAPGETLKFPAGTRVTFSSQEQYRRDILVLFFGNNRFDNGMRLAGAGEPLTRWESVRFLLGIRNILLRRLDGKLPFVVLGRTGEGDELDRVYAKIFGSHYLRAGEKDLRLMGQDDFTRLAKQVYDSLKEQGAFARVEEAVEEALGLVL